ncbi:hypothetical protein [Streptomyces sp. NPDC085665]|uniref:hypothetical protein n=1 Tax=Streptomyces sp. NPDC085665 TaxID=3365735 RepID=UPI0037CF6E61
MDYSLVIAAAQAAGPCPPGDVAAWGRTVQELTVELHVIAQQAAQDVARLENAKTFVAFLEKVEIEDSSRRGKLTLRTPSGDAEHIRTEQQDTDRGRRLIARAESLVGRWVLVYRYNETMASNQQLKVRMLAHLMDLGDGDMSVNTAKKVLLDDAGGVVARAQAAWAAAGLPEAGTVTVEELQRARLGLQAGS